MRRIIAALMECMVDLHVHVYALEMSLHHQPMTTITATIIVSAKIIWRIFVKHLTVTVHVVNTYYTKQISEIILLYHLKTDIKTLMNISALCIHEI